jgi:protein TonB
VTREVKPKYTSDAMIRKVEGTVVLEFVVRSDGRPSDIRVLRSLDPGGLDEQAMIAAGKWRFDPGRLGTKPVDVLVTLYLDFSLR